MGVSDGDISTLDSDRSADLAAALGSCPLPKADYEHVLLGHGSGGLLTNELIHDLFVPGFGGETLAGLEDQATLDLVAADDGSNGRAGAAVPRLAMTTDSFVVQPLFFPGGDIGKLAVCGTVNDLAVGGAVPKFLAAAFIIEEGLPIKTLRRVVASMRAACEEAGVALVTGDTKVVDRGKGDEVFITTTGIGVAPGRGSGVNLSIRGARVGDKIIVNGTLGDHGIAIMSVREGIEFETPLESDCACLAGLTRTMLTACPNIRLMRDATRGGLASVLNEMATASDVGVRLMQSQLPIRPEVRGACEMLGLDVAYVANEGKLIAVAPPEDADELLEVMRRHPLGQDAAIIGEIVDDHPGMVIQRSLIGGERVVTMLTGEQLPRIC